MRSWPPCREASELARLLVAKGWIPDIVLASNARRSKQTLEEMGGVMEALADADSHLYGSLYTINALDGQTRQHIEEVREMRHRGGKACNRGQGGSREAGPWDALYRNLDGAHCPLTAFPPLPPPSPPRHALLPPRSVS